MKKLNLFSRMCSPRVGLQNDESSTRLRVVFDSFTCRLRVCPLKLVSVLAILLTVGVGSVWADISLYTEGWESNHRTSGSNNYSTTTKTYGSWTFYRSDAISNSGISGSYLARCRVAGSSTDSPYIISSALTLSTDHISQVSWKCKGNTNISLTAYYSTDGSNWSVGKSATSLPSSSTSWSFNLDVTGTLYLKFVFTVASSTNSSRDGDIDDITVTGSHAAASKYTVSFETGTGNPTQANITEASGGAGITLPAGPTPTCSGDGWSFAGWKETSAQSSASAPSSKLWQAGETYSPAANTTLYAVYFKASGNYYQYIDNINSLFDGAKMIITAYNSEESTEYAVSNTMDGDGYIYSSSVSPDGDDVISSPANSIVWTLKGYKDSWTLKNVGNNKYIIVSTLPALADASETVSITYEVDEDDYDQFNIQNGSKYLYMWADNTFSGYNKTYLYLYQQQGTYNTNPSCAACDADPTIGAASLNGSFNMTSTTSAIGVASGTCSTGNAACDWTDYGFVWSDGANTTTPTVGGTNCNKVQVGTSGNGTSWTGSVTPSGSTTPTSWTTGHTYYVRTYGKNSKTGAEFVHGTAFSFTPRSITFNSNGGSAVSTIYVNSGTAASAPTAPTRSHYTFGGWYTASDLKTAVDWSSTISEDKTYYAKWTEDPYKTVVFKNNDDEIDGYASVKVYVGERPNAPTLTDGTAHDACDATSDKHYGWTKETWTSTIATKSEIDERTGSEAVYEKSAALPLVAEEDPATIIYHAVWAQQSGTPSNEYQLVTNISQLSAGDKIVIAGAKTTSTYLLGYQRHTDAGYHFRPQSSNAYTITSSKVTLTSSDIAAIVSDETHPYVLTLGKNGDYWTFYDAVNGGYLCATTADKNELNVRAEDSDGASRFTISISSDAASITSQVTPESTPHNLLQYLTNTFSCYKSTSGGTNPYIFRNLSTLSNSNFMTTCCDKNITIGTPSITGSGTVTFALGGSAIEYGDAVETCSGAQDVVATVTPSSGYECTALSFSGGSVSVDPTPGASNYPAYSSTYDYTLSFGKETTSATLSTSATFSAKALTGWSWKYKKGDVNNADPASVIPDVVEAYIGEYVKFVIDGYTPSDVISDKQGYVYDQDANPKQPVYHTDSLAHVGHSTGYYTTRGKVAGKATLKFKAVGNASIIKTMTILTKALPTVTFVDIVQNKIDFATSDDDGYTASSGKLASTVSSGIVSHTKHTPTHADVSAPVGGNSCETSHLHLIGWIRSDCPAVDAYMSGTGAKPGNTAITGAGDDDEERAYFLAPNANINVETFNGLTFYAVWAKIE